MLKPGRKMVRTEFPSGNRCERSDVQMVKAGIANRKALFQFRDDGVLLSTD